MPRMIGTKNVKIKPRNEINMRMMREVISITRLYSLFLDIHKFYDWVLITPDQESRKRDHTHLKGQKSKECHLYKNGLP